MPWLLRLRAEHGSGLVDLLLRVLPPRLATHYAFLGSGSRCRSIGGGVPIRIASQRAVASSRSLGQYAGGASEKRLPPKEVLNFQAPDRAFAVNKGLQTEVPHPDAAPVYRRPNGASLCCIALTPCR
jgi:hypothetical protein